MLYGVVLLPPRHGASLVSVSGWEQAIRLDGVAHVIADTTAGLIAAAKEHAPDARFIMASTGLVYDSDLPRPAREEDPANAPTRLSRAFARLPAAGGHDVPAGREGAR
jgi:nucleoside-diphosphate-sugar epimerase